MTKGKFIVFEGLDFSGKTTQAKLLADWMGDTCVLTKEPNDCDYRNRILNDPGMTVAERFMLLMADRAKHIDSVVRPALTSGKHVVCDRFFWSTVAYQGSGFGVSLSLIEQVHNYVCKDLAQPDFVLYMSVPMAKLAANASARGTELDFFESQGNSFRTKLVSGYNFCLENYPHMLIECGDLGVSEVHKLVISKLIGRL